MKPGAFIGALAGAVIGAAVWAGIVIVTNYEVGIVAWGIGGLIGLLAMLGGAKGQAMGMVCAAFALLSIFGGKVVAVRHFMQQMVDEVDVFSIKAYDELAEDARRFSALASEEDWPQYMIDRSFTGAETVDEIGSDEINEFRNDTAPELRRFAQTKPTYESWRAEKVGQAQTAMPSIFSGAMIGLTVRTLGLFDVIFGLLGLATAYGMVARAGEEDAA
jgi:hypothetical protein